MLLPCLAAAAAAGLGLCAGLARALAVTNVSTSVLGVDPEGSAILNGESFTQNALTTFNGWQYAAFYNSSGTYLRNFVAVARRPLVPAVGAWQPIVFEDYVQSTEDGHNIISIGIAPGDGSIHLSYDHHDVPLNYRVSVPGVATSPATVAWSTALFGATLHALPGAVPGNFTPLTYPRFEPVGADLLMEYRIGESGAGDSYLFMYSSATHAWTETGRYIMGDNNNAYINGMQYIAARGTLQTSWTWRETPDVVTNHDLGYAISHDLGKTWLNTNGTLIGNTTADAPITPTSPGSLVFAIAQDNGILNQEGQWGSADGGFHVLDRQNTTGQYLWYHYYRAPAGAWTARPLTTPTALVNNPMPTGFRGKLAVREPSGELLAIVPSNQDSRLWVLQSTLAGAFQDWSVLWQGDGFASDTLWDEQRLNLPVAEGGGVLSLFVRHNGSYPTRTVAVVDLTLA